METSISIPAGAATQSNIQSDVLAPKQYFAKAFAGSLQFHGSQETGVGIQSMKLNSLRRFRDTYSLRFNWDQQLFVFQKLNENVPHVIYREDFIRSFEGVQPAESWSDGKLVPWKLPRIEEVWELLSHLCLFSHNDEIGFLKTFASLHFENSPGSSVSTDQVFWFYENFTNQPQPVFTADSLCSRLFEYDHQSYVLMLETPRFSICASSSMSALCGSPAPM